MTTRILPSGLVVTNLRSMTAMMPDGTVLTVIGSIVAVATVDDINTDENVDDGEQNVTFTTSNFDNEISTVVLKSGSAETNATGVTSSGGAGDFDLPDVSQYVTPTVGCPLTTTNNVVVAELSDA